MFTQKEVLRSGVGMTFGQTYEFDLPKNGQLMGLVLYLRSKHNSYPFLTAVKWRLIDYISKIEVIGDGSEIIKVYDGRQALAAAFYDDGRVPPHIWRHYSNVTDRQWLPINFGRWRICATELQHHGAWLYVVREPLWPLAAAGLVLVAAGLALDAAVGGRKGWT